MGGRILTLGLLALLTLAAGCTTTGASHLGPIEGPLPSGVDDEVLEAGAIAEATLTLSRLWSVAGGVNQVGSRLSFSIWSERGAFTLVGYSASARAGPPGQPVDEENFQQEMANVLTRFAQRHTGMVTLNLERHAAHWAVSYSASTPPRPPEAKTLPVRRAGLPATEVLAISQGVRQLFRPVELQPGAEARVEVDLTLEDSRVEDWHLRLFELTSSGNGGSPRPLAPAVLNELVAVLLPFTVGVGERTVRLELRLASGKEARQVHGWVEQAFVERPPSPSELEATFVTEYRLMHEDILRRWREESRDGGEWVATRGAEELAVWYAGGVVIRGLGWLGARVAPTVVRALRRGKDAAAGWLRTTLTRIPQDRRQVFERLWAKVQLEGRHSLSANEREELRALMESLEQVIRAPLDSRAKERLRAAARNAYKRHHPHLAEILDEKGFDLPIHHRRPLEYAHLFPEEDINTRDNLVMVTRDVHERINALWTKFRQARPEATAKDVQAATQAIDGPFHPWYHQPRASLEAPHALKEAEKAALERLQRIFQGLQ